MLAMLGRGLSASGATMTGYLSAAAHEVEEGYFSVGPDSYLIVKPGSDMHRWLSQNLGKTVTLSVVVSEASE
jgi:hypothetical protein